jgi:hypothetical protein
MGESAKTEAALRDLAERFAAIEHERWSHWQLYMHSMGERRSDGSLLLPADLVARWERQAATAFADLTEHEKESDREQVSRYLPIIADLLRKAGAS